MSPKLPVISGAELIRALGKFGYVAVRQKGSHVRLRHATDPQRLPVTVPLHPEIAFGTLRRILRDASISVEAPIGVVMAAAARFEPGAAAFDFKGCGV